MFNQFNTDLVILFYNTCLSADDSVGKMTSLLLKASANTGRAVRCPGLAKIDLVQRLQHR